MISMSNNAVAGGDLGSPMEAKQVFLQTDQRLPINPSVIEATDDGFIVAGDSGDRAWAAKTDMAGKILWTYHVEKPSSSGSSPWLQVSPIFSCAAALSDGSFWLIGSTIDRVEKVGLLVHLDRQGKVIESRTAVPPLGASRGNVNLLIDCVRWGDGVAIVGSTSLPRSAVTPRSGNSQPVASSSVRKAAYWVLILGPNGNTTFEEIIPTGYERSIGSQRSGMSLQAVGSQLIVSAQTGADTEVLRLDPSGTARVQKHYANAFLSLVRPVVPDGKIQLLGTVLEANGSTRSKSLSSVELIALNDDLEELRRQTVPRQMVPKVTYRLPNESLLVFGADIHQVGEQYTSQIARFDDRLNSIQVLNPSRTTYSDTGSIDTATPVGTTGRFVSATVAVVRGFPEKPIHIDALPGFLRGAALEFIDIQ